LVILPEEAEDLIPIIRGIDNPVTYLLTYAAPATRKMLRFNSLTFYTLPAMPPGWKPPTWLTIELGIFAGRLYFDFEEYSDLCGYLGCEDGGNRMQLQDGNTLSSKPQPANASAALEEAKMKTGTREVRGSFVSEPLTFLQGWLAIRRKGQDFTHTPMGYVCQGKLLTQSHPFFARLAASGRPFSQEDEQREFTNPRMEIGDDGSGREEGEDEFVGEDGDIYSDDGQAECYR